MFVVICGDVGVTPLSLLAKFPAIAKSIVVYNEQRSALCTSRMAPRVP
jgi:hypothetical protein